MKLTKREWFVIIVLTILGVIVVHPASFNLIPKISN